MHHRARLRLRRGAVLAAVAAFVATMGCSEDGLQGPDSRLEPPSGIVRLSWDAPTANSDGSRPLFDLAGYVVCHGTSEQDLGTCVDTGAVTRVALDLPLGQHFVAVKAYDRWLNESEFSNVIRVEVTAAE